MQRRQVLKGLAATVPALWLQKLYSQKFWLGNIEPIADGPFQPTWESLAAYNVPDWYRDAKFGMWAHWGPQCQPEYGDWYAREMYNEGSNDYKYHVQRFGHPSKFGFKDVINDWKAEKWDPEQLVSLYKKAGARYFFALANHHDNFDLWHSTHQRWNAVNLGPKKDLISGWAKAARNNGLPFGVSVHSAHAWIWYETAQRSDKSGPLAGVPYDGKLTKADGKGTWWEGYDPQELYAQNHALSKGSENTNSIGSQWAWGNGANVPPQAYLDNFYDRTMELIEKYNPDLLYFDDTVLPFHPISDVGLRIAAHHYNSSIKKHGKLRAVLNGKVLNEAQRKCLVWDVERGAANEIQPQPWQTDTCIGNWHYDRPLYERNGYKSAKTVVQIMADVVSKNGNLLLNIPVRGNGTIDEKELAVVEEIGEWMAVNSEAIYATRPWKIFGEGPAIASAAPIQEQGFNEGKGKPLGAEDFRFTTKGNTLYAIFFGWPENGQVVAKTLGTASPQMKGKKIAKATLLGHKGSLDWKQESDGLTVKLPATAPCKNAYVLKLHT